MLNKRFKIAKCKTSLKLATARINIMRNKKVVQINQMKKELAQLLDSGQDRTARIRVEHVIREQKMVAAYDLIEIYCELIVARLSIIESQKTCPIDLKEAVTSVIFAAPRCSDITELVDVRKNFTAKYGKEFVTAALELHPDCGVNRMLVEKLSAVAPDVQTKMKVLTTVAKEHNISWDPTSVEEIESKPPNDLNGPTNFEKLSTINVNPPEIQTSNFSNVHSHDVNSNVSFDFSQQNKRFTLDSQNTSSPDTSSIQTSSASSTRDDTRPSGMPSGTMNTRQSFHNNEKDSWNMEFKDATSAAQAAAESAERASFAARAAAQLSSQGKITRQYSSESQNSQIRDEKPQVSELSGQRRFKDSYNTSFNDRNSKISNQQMGSSNDTPPKVTKKSSSSRSQNDSVNESSRNNFHHADGYHETHEDQGYYYSETSSKKESMGRLNSDKNERSFKSSNDDYHRKDVIGTQPPVTPSRSHSSTTGDNHKVGQGTAIDQENLFIETTKTSSYDDAHRDEETDSDSDADGHLRFDMGFEYDEGEAKSFFPSPGREAIRPLENTHISTPKKNSAKSVDLPDGQDSESESEVAKSGFSGTEKFISPRKHDLFSTHQEPAYVESSPKEKSRKSRIELNDLIENESEMGKAIFSGTKKSTSPRKTDVFSTRQEPVEQLPNDNSRKARIELNDLIVSDSESELEMGKSSFSRTKKLTSPGKHNYNSGKYHMVEKGSSFHNPKENSDYLKQCDVLDTGNDLMFGTLKGGRRNNAGLKYPPYLKTASPSSKNSVEESPIKVDPTSKQSSFNLRVSRLDKKKPSVSMSSSESDSDNYSDKFPRKSSKPRSPFAPPVAFFDSDGTDSEGEIPTRTPTGKIPLVSGESLRTKGQVEPKAKTFISKQSPTEPQFYTENFNKNPDTNLESSEISSTSAFPKSSRRPEPRPHKVHLKQEPFGTMPVPKLSEEQPNPHKRIVQSGKNEASKTTDVPSKASLAENNVRKPSHVHPKLPDFESLAARIQALQSDHK